MLPVIVKQASHNEVLMTIITPTYRKVITTQMIEQMLTRLTQAS